MVCPRSLRRCNNLLIRGIEPAVADIFHDTALEQPRILQHHTKGIAKLSAVEIPDIVVIQKNGSAVYIIITHQQLNHRRFSCSGRADNGNFLTRFYLRAEIMNDDLVRIVSELYMIKGYCSCYCLNVSRIFRGLILFLFVQEFKDTLGCRRHRLYHVDHLRNLLDWLGKVFYILDECLDITDCNHVSDCQQTSGQCHTGVTQIPDKHHNRLHHAG